MRVLFILFLFCGCSLSKVNYKPGKQNITPAVSHASSFKKADTNNDSVIDLNESVLFFNEIKSEEVYSPAYSFLFIIGLVFLFVFVCVLFSRRKD